MRCRNCGSEERATIFQGMAYCSDNCRRALGIRLESEREFHELNPLPDFYTEREKALLTVIGALLYCNVSTECMITQRQLDQIKDSYATRVEFTKGGGAHVVLGPLT